VLWIDSLGVPACSLHPKEQNDVKTAVVWLSGEHDLSTVDALSETLARAFALDEADVVLDLSGVQFMGAATIEVIVRAKDVLDLRSRALTLRSPSESTQRVVELCGLADLVDPSSADAQPLVGTNVGR
jgi:anti-sigma B factor antagonist